MMPTWLERFDRSYKSLMKDSSFCDLADKKRVSSRNMLWEAIIECGLYPPDFISLASMVSELRLTVRQSRHDVRHDVRHEVEGIR